MIIGLGQSHKSRDWYLGRIGCAGRYGSRKKIRVIPSEGMEIIGKAITGASHRAILHFNGIVTAAAWGTS